MPAGTDDRRFILLLVGLCLFLFFFCLGSRALWDVDEGMHSVSARYVVEVGDWVTPHYNGEAFFDKPMLFTWMVAISFWLFGFTELAARLPAALLGLAGVLVTFELGRRMFGVRTGFLSGAVLASSILYLVMSRTVVHDSALAFFTTVALGLFYVAVIDADHRKLCFRLFYVALGGAVLAKGPLGLLLPGLVVVPFLLMTGRRHLIREMEIRWGIPVFVILTAPWYVLMGLRNEGYFWYFLIEKSFGSFASSESTHPAPLHFYVPVLFGALLPWTGFFPAAILSAGQRWRGRKRDEILFLLLWLGGMFLFFSMATSKLASYLLPLMPAAAILIALIWKEAEDDPAGSNARLLLWSQVPVALILGGMLAFGLLEPPLDLEVKYGITPPQMLTVGLLVTVGPLVTLVLLARHRITAAFGSLVCLVAAVLAVFATWMGPAMDDYRSSRELALAIDPLLPPGEPIVFFWREKDSALFYTDRDGRILPTWEVEEFLATTDEVLFVADVRELHRLREHRQDLGVIMRHGNKVVISNRPAAERAEAVPKGFTR